MNHIIPAKLLNEPKIYIPTQGQRNQPTTRDYSKLTRQQRRSRHPHKPTSMANREHNPFRHLKEYKK
jgi:hypothetical protein